MSLQVEAAEDMRPRRVGTFTHARRGYPFNLELYPGHGYCNDLISFRLAVNLGCILKFSECIEYSYLTYHPLSVHSTTSLKLRIRGPFAPNPQWVRLDAIVIDQLEHPQVCDSDIVLSWSTQRQLRVESHEEPTQRVYQSIQHWEEMQKNRTTFEAAGCVFLEKDFKPPSPPNHDSESDSDSSDSGAEV